MWDGLQPVPKMAGSMHRSQLMRHLALISVSVLIAVSCATPQPGASRNASLPGHGAISISIQPNPIVAQKVSGNTYQFPFYVSVRETGGRPVTINRIALDIYAVGGIRVASETYD